MKGFHRLVQIFERSGPRILSATCALAFLGLWAAFPTQAGAACNPAAHSNLTNRDRVAPAFLTRDLAQPTVVASRPTNDQDGPSIVGLWHILLFNPDGSTFDEGYDVWHSDGTEILNDTAPPQPANGSGTVCLGVYEKTGPRAYKIKHPFWSFDATGSLIGTGVFLDQVTLDENGNSFSGTYDFITYDLNENITFEQKGDLKADRITPD
jgi:hypothetical protein